MDTEIEIEEDDDFFVPRRSLLTTREKELAQSRADLLKMFAEKERATAEAEVARREARELREHIIATSTGKTKVSFRTMAVAFTAVIMLSAIGKVAYFGFGLGAARTEAVDRTESTTAPPARSKGKRAARAAADLKFNMAIERLQTDFNSLPGDEAEIVREVNAQHAAGLRPCPLEWNNGEVALSLDGKNGDVPRSLVDAIDQCADATEKYRSDRETALEAAEGSGR